MMSWDCLVSHWVALVISAAIVVLLICLFFYLRWIKSHRPKENIGNGIIVGPAKAFDNRSLALKIERLNRNLEDLKVINQNMTEGLENIQEQTRTDTSQAISLTIKSPAGAAADGKSRDAEKADNKSSASAAPDGKAVTGLAASDMLSNQLNLQSQIFNLQTLYERSLSDRMLGGQSRLQTVLGFQVSITPPSGYENCVAIMEVAVRSKDVPTGATKQVSLVALMPQEKTYNAESVSSSERSIEGSAVIRAVPVGYSRKGQSQQLFIHRDADTIAFERDPNSKPSLFDANGTVFGWEFRPVLGRRAVSPGTRQMLAVIALPEVDSDQAKTFNLEIKTRSYWRHYNRKKQTTGPNWSWLPGRGDRSGITEFPVQMLEIPNTASIQTALAPQVTDIRWVNSGQGKATVIVKGRNFFSGTKVVIDGKVHQESDGTLILKSDQALEFETSIASLVTGDAVLSGRFGPSFQLKVPDGKLSYESLDILRASIEPSRHSKSFRIGVEVKGLDPDGNPMEFTVAKINQDWPEPILFLGSEPVPMPYDYYEIDPATLLATTPPPGQPASQPAAPGAAAGGAPAGAPAAPSTPPPTPDPKYIRIEAWISQAMLAKNSSVSFRVPFGGVNYNTSQPLSFSEPTVTRIGSNANSTIFRIDYPLGFSTGLSIQLDQTYLAPPNVQQTSDTECVVTLPNDLVSRFEKMIVHTGSTGDSYVVALPSKERVSARPTLDPAAKPPTVQKNSRGPVEFAGSALDTITDVTLAGVSQQFKTYGNGSGLMVYLNAGCTSSEGKLSLEATTSSGDKLELTMFVV
jgi:hypothetical protein